MKTYETIQGLEHCKTSDCGYCPYNKLSKQECQQVLMQDALNLFESSRAEIKRLSEELREAYDEIEELSEE